MNYIMVRHKVLDNSKWKSVFDTDSGSGLLEKAGFKKYGLYRTLEDPTDLVVFLEVADINQVKQFFASEDAKKRMKEATVTSTPEVTFLEMIEKKEIAGKKAA
jgi:hypothetical protein